VLALLRLLLVDLGLDLGAGSVLPGVDLFFS
jgi:hypothetical protein